MAEEKDKTITGSQEQKAVTPQAEGELSDAAVEKVQGGSGVTHDPFTITMRQDQSSPN